MSGQRPGLAGPGRTIGELRCCPHVYSGRVLAWAAARAFVRSGPCRVQTNNVQTNDNAVQTNNDEEGATMTNEQLDALLRAPLAAAGFDLFDVVASGLGTSVATVQVFVDLATFTTGPAPEVASTRIDLGHGVHEIDIVRTTLDPAKLPIKASGQFNEHTPQARVVKEAVKVLPGTTRTFTAKLTPGSYVIVDNLPGHYRAGETAALKIT